MISWWTDTSESSGKSSGRAGNHLLGWRVKVSSWTRFATLRLDFTTKALLVAAFLCTVHVHKMTHCITCQKREKEGVGRPKVTWCVLVDKDLERAWLSLENVKDRFRKVKTLFYKMTLLKQTRSYFYFF